MAKACRDCGLVKPLDEFYVHRMMLDGHLNKCKNCVRQRVRRRANANRERIRAAGREYAKRPESLARAVANARLWRARGPAARAAHVAVGRALRTGRLKRGRCEVCKSLRVHAHHDDYLKPLEVRWLCAEHHRKWHLEHGPGANQQAETPRQKARRRKAA